MALNNDLLQASMSENSSDSSGNNANPAHKSRQTLFLGSDHSKGSLSETLWHHADLAKREVIDLVYPPACRLCGDWVPRHHEFCQTCQTQLEMTAPLMRNACSRCGHPAPSKDQADGDIAKRFSYEERSGDPGCARCRDLEFHFDSVITRWIYRDRVCDAIVACKFTHHAALANALANRLADRVDEYFGEERPFCDDSAGDETSRPDGVTFVPSHFFRQLTRGGNGNRIFAGVLARRLNVPVHEFLRLSRSIAKQAWLDDEARKQNVSGAFLLRKSYAWRRSPKLVNQHILLVDDVLTTGATANEVARVLKQAGAKRVTLAVTARAVRS